MNARAVLMAIFCFSISAQGLAATFTVDNTGDAVDANIGDGVCATAGAVCTLRAAIEEANALAGADTINFSIPGPANQSSGADSWWSITPTTVLPAISGADTVIDATTQTTNQGNTNSLGPEIEINGTTVGAGGWDGFGVITPASGVIIKGFIINRWSGAGISFWTGTGTATGNYIGTNHAGTAALANTSYGIYANTSGNTIGGNTAATRNVVAGNSGPGIAVYGNNNIIQGNYIGVNATSSAALGNTIGISLLTTATGNSIGGTAAGAGNVISGNSGDGINQSASGANAVQGNYIGTDAASASLPNGGDGVEVSAGTINLGNASESQSNVIGPNTGVGVNLTGGTINLAGTVNVKDDLTLSTGTLSMGSVALNVSGNWSRTSATVTEGTSTVTLNGAALQTVLMSGSNFNNLIITNASAAGVQFLDGFSTVNFTDTTAASKLTFKAGATYTVSGTLTLTGGSGSEITLLSDAAGSRFTLNVTGGAQTVSYVNVKDSQASANNITANTSTNSGGNDDAEATPRWIFTTLTISGTVYTDEGVTNIGSGKTLRLLVNGVSAGTNVTNASGQYSITTTINAGDALLIYIDGDATYKGATVTVASALNLSGVDVYATHLITRHDNAGSFSNANMSAAKGAYVDTDIQYSESGGNLTVSGTGTVLYIPAGHSYAPGGNVTTPAMKSLGTFSGGAGAIDINGALTVAGGTYTASSGTTYIAAGFTVSAGTFNHNNGLITFDGGAKTVNIGSAALYNVTFNMAAIMTVSGTMRIDGDLTITVINFVNTGTVTIAGNVTTNDASAGGSAEFQFIGTGNQILNAPGVSGAIPNVVVNKPSGTLTLQGTIEVDGSRTWRYLSGTVDAGTSTVVFDYWNKAISATGMSFNNVRINITANTFNLVIDGTMDINGDLAITAVNNIDIGIGPGVITVAGNVSSSDVAVGGTALLTLDGTGNQTITGAGSDFPNGLFTINKTGGTASLASHLVLNGTGQNLTVTAGTFDLVGFNLTLPNTLTVANGGVLRLQGGEALSTSANAFNAGSTVIYNGGGTYASLAAGNAYSNLTFNNAAGSWTHTGALSTSNLTVTAGTLTSAGQNVNVAGNFSNTGTYVSGSNTFTFNGTSQSISGNTVFNNFTKSVASADTLTFAAGSTTTINGTATLNGASGQLLSLLSSTPGMRWNFTLSSSATKAISYVDVRDSDASGSAAARLPINPANSSDSGNNISWFAITLTGTVYTDEGITTIGAGKTVRLLKNGVSLGTAVTDAAGAFGFNADVATGDALLLYIDGNDGVTTDATTVTVSPGGASSNLDLYVNHFITRHDNTGTLTNAIMGTAKGAYSDTEILSTVAAGNLTVSGTGTVLYTPAGHSYAPGGNITTPGMKSLGTFNGGTGNIGINGSLTVAGGVYTATSGTTTILGNFTGSAGTFTHNSGTVVFNNSNHAISSGAMVFNNVIINANSFTTTVSGTMTVAGNLTIASEPTINGGTIEVAGNVVTTAVNISGNAIVLINGTGAQNLMVNGAGGTGWTPGISINKPSGTLTIQDVISIRGGGWTHAAGTVNAGTSTVIFGNASSAINPGTMSFNNVSFTGTSVNYAITGTVTLSGSLVLSNQPNLNGGTVTVAGNVSSTATGGGGTTAITLNGSGAQTINATRLPNGGFTINKPAGVATLAAGLTLYGGALTVNSGTFDLAGFNLSLPGALTVANGASLRLQGGETVTTPTRSFNAGSTVIYNGGATYTSLAAGNTYSNLTFNNAAGSWTHTVTLTVNNLTLTAGALSSGGQNIDCAGNWSNSGTYTAGGNTVTLNGANQTLSGATTFYNLSKVVTSADTLTFAAGSTTSVAAGGKLTLTGAPGNLLRLRSATPGTEWFLNVGAGVAPAANYVDVQDSNAGGGQTIYAYYSTDSLRNTNWVFGQQLQLVKQVWDLAGNCLASRPADAACNGGVDSVTVPAGSAVRFVIFVRNPMAVTASDLRLQDLIDDSGFTYQAGTLRRSTVDGTAPADTATLATLHAAATVVQTDARDGATQIDEFTGIDTAASPDLLTVGGTGGAGDNDMLNLPAYKTFVIAFRAVKN